MDKLKALYADERAQVQAARNEAQTYRTKLEADVEAQLASANRRVAQGDASIPR